MTAENFAEFEEKTSQVIEKRGRPSAVSLMEIFIVMLVKV